MCEKFTDHNCVIRIPGNFFKRISILTHYDSTSNWLFSMYHLLFRKKKYFELSSMLNLVDDY